MNHGFPINLALPDLWQQEAVRHLREGKDVVVDAPTGAGKTRIFELIAESGHLHGQAIYTVPTRALANDKRLEWAAKGWHVGIATGDLAENLDAPVLVATLETQRELFLEGRGPRLLVIDEYQMIGDAVRGLTYELSVALAPPTTQLLLLSGSVGNPGSVVEWLVRLGRKAELVSTKERPVPLDEVPLEALSRRAPHRLTHFWPRVAAEVLLNNLGPLLIFAPQRNHAEKIAKQISAALPTPDTLTLTERQEHILGGTLSGLLRQRIAFHHSGLSYLQRAGVIEPLAKAGQLRVVVATMGLAAGINFSMRSVIIGESLFHDGKAERQIQPDELLQMFGRAGRRGMDEVGYVIVADRSPRLSDASPKHLRRANQIDWPTLLRVMHRASERGESPFPAATRLCDSLFSKQHIQLGFERTAAPAAPEPEPPNQRPEGYYGIGPSRVEVFNSRGMWEIKDKGRFAEAPLGLCLMHYKNRFECPLQVFTFMSNHFPIGRVCKLDKGHGNFIYGKELPLAIERKPRCFFLTRNIRELIDQSKDQAFTYDQLDDQILPQLTPHLHGGRVSRVVQRGEILMLQIDFSKTLFPVYFDMDDAPLVAPEEREVKIEVSTSYVDETGTEHKAPRHSAAYAWRKLGLIDPRGVPTLRGLVFSCFQGGEGLAIAAALEDETYPLEDLVIHLANLRGGVRFQDVTGGNPGGSERLAAACLKAYGTATYEGYLEMGLPIGYGEGTAEILAEILHKPNRKRELATEHFGEGDFERALVEWLSLLRQIKYAPAIVWDRWHAFQEICAAERNKYAHLVPTRELPPIPAAQLYRLPNYSALSQA